MKVKHFEKSLIFMKRGKTKSNSKLYNTNDK